MVTTLHPMEAFVFVKKFKCFLMCKDGLLPMFLQKNHIPYDPDGSYSSDSSKLGGIWITGRKNFLINIF